MTVAKAFASPAIALFVMPSNMTSSLETVRAFPLFLSRTFMGLLRTSANIVTKFFEPFGLPLGLPDWPGLNWRLPGRRRYPTTPFGLPSFGLDSLIIKLHYRPAPGKRLGVFSARRALRN